MNATSCINLFIWNMKNKSIAEERELAVAVVLWARERDWLLINIRWLFGIREDILKADSGDEYTALWANQTLRMAKMVNIIPRIFYAGKKWSNFFGVMEHWWGMRILQWNCLDLHTDFAAHWLEVSSQNILNSCAFHLQRTCRVIRQAHERFRLGLGQGSVRTLYGVSFSCNGHTRYLSIYHTLIQPEAIEAHLFLR